jgi:hypothetical protein
MKEKTQLQKKNDDEKEKEKKQEVDKQTKLQHLKEAKINFTRFLLN